MPAGAKISPQVSFGNGPSADNAFSGARDNSSENSSRQKERERIGTTIAEKKKKTKKMESIG